MCHNYIHITKCVHLTPIINGRKHIQGSLTFKKTFAVTILEFAIQVIIYYFSQNMRCKYAKEPSP